MLRISLFTQTIFCLVSMTLTSLFALSLSGVSLDSLNKPGENTATLLLACIFILIGSCIDVGKYLFWMFRKQSQYFISLSIILMVFSWVASCAFLMTSESKLVSLAQLKTSEYVALEQRISNLTLDIASQEKLLSNRLESTYHSQWEAGQDTAATLAGLRETLATLLESSSTVGQQTAVNVVASTRFFQQVGESLYLDTNTIRLIGYGVLSLLLELSTLGMISLSQVLKNEKRKSLIQPTSDDFNSVMLNREAHLSVVNLMTDIMTGEMPPVLRKIQAAKYGIEIDITRNLLKKLHNAGMLERDKRNSYKLPL